MFYCFFFFYIVESFLKMDKMMIKVIVIIVNEGSIQLYNLIMKLINLMSDCGFKEVFYKMIIK